MCDLARYGQTLYEGPIDIVTKKFSNGLDGLKVAYEGYVASVLCIPLRNFFVGFTRSCFCLPHCLE